MGDGRPVCARQKDQNSRERVNKKLRVVISSIKKVRRVLRERVTGVR